MTKKQRYQFNIYFTFISHFLMAFSAAWGVIKIFHFESIGVSFEQIGFLLSFGVFLIILLEIPTGIISDMYGRKTSIILSFICCLIDSYMFLIAKDFFDLFIACIFLSLSWAFWSGSFESLLYETTKLLRIKDKYSWFLNKSNVLFITLGIATNYFIPKIYEINSDYVFYLSIYTAIILIFLSMFLKEPEYKKDKKIIEHNLSKQLFSIKNIFFNDKFLQSIILWEVFFVFGLVIFGELVNQPLIYKNYSLSDYGLMFAAAKIVQSVISFYTDSYIKLFSKRGFFYFLSLSWFVSGILLVIFIDYFWLCCLIMGYIWSVGMFNYVFISNLTNNHIKDNNVRSSLLSSISMLRGIGIFIFSLIFGFILEYTNVLTTTYILFCISTILGLFIIKKSHIFN